MFLAFYFLPYRVHNPLGDHLQIHPAEPSPQTPQNPDKIT